MHFGKRVQMLLAGITAGVVSTVITHPPDVIKTYMQISRMEGMESIAQVSRHIWQVRDG